MGVSELRAYLGEDWTRMEALVQEALSSDIDLLREVNARILAHRGKMLRPAISMLVARACGGGRLNEDSLRFAAASEMFHNSTLLHDDVVDGSAERRGEPTLLSTLGATPSVLVGDFWLVKAVSLVLPSRSNSDEVVNLFAKTLSDLAEGEMLQLEKAGVCDTSQDDYYRIIYSKTASLFEATAVSAAVSVGAPREWVEAVREYAVCLGMAFQIKDDLLDYDGRDLGKPTGVDLREHKITLPLLGALLGVEDERNRMIRQMVCEIDAHPEYVERITEFVHTGGGVAYAEERQDEFVRQAIAALDVLPESTDRNWLERVARYVTRREN